MTDPSALALIDIEHNLVFAHVLTTTTAGLSAVSSSELVARGPASTSTSTVTVSSSSSRMGETVAGRLISTAVTARTRSGRGFGGFGGRGEFKVLEEVRVDLLSRVEDLRCAVRVGRRCESY